LLSRIAAEIRRTGPMRFDRFQALALYDPAEGYYESLGRVGRAGDFVTGASWHPAFARAIARIVERVSDQIQGPIEVVDVGCGEGEFLASFRMACPDHERVRLVGVEGSNARRAEAMRRVPDAVFLSDTSELPASLTGLVFAYELFDALPIRALRFMESGELAERTVGLTEDGELCWSEEKAGESRQLLETLRARSVSLEPGQALEVRPASGPLARALASRLRKGLLLIFDYGAPARALYAPTRFDGTLEAFSRHQVSRDVLSSPGQRDLTSWVDFTELSETLAAEGLDVKGLVSQSRLLIAAGIAEELAEEGHVSPERSVERNAIAKLFMPGGMGESLRVLVAERGIQVGESLLRFPEV
jgi:SAM-dependent MidA family methyltransferase